MAVHNDTTIDAKVRFLRELGDKLREDRHRLAVDMWAHRQQLRGVRTKIRNVLNTHD